MTDDLQQLRLQLLANGYQLTRNRDKRTFQKGWPTTIVDEAEVARWSRRFKRDTATGIRVEDGLAVIDFDVNDAAMMARIVNAVLDAIPDLEKADVPLLVRQGSGAKEAWFVRTEELFSRIHSRAWLAPGTNADDGAHRVEIFGGASPRQFGSFGPHTVADDGNVKTWYRWTDRSPADTLKSELPALTKAQFFAIADIVERELSAAGWSVVEKSTKGENEVSRVYDLTEEMLFDLDTGDRVSLQQLRELAAGADAAGQTIRCSAAWLEGPSAKRTDRCIVSSTASGGVAVWESSSSVTHCEVSLKPRDFGPEINRIAERLKEIDERRRNKVHSGDGAVVAATKMLATYAFCPNLKNGVVPIYATSVDDCIAMQAFRTLMAPNCDEEVGPLGGRKIVSPVDIWTNSERRVTVRGLRMRPDRERPIYEDDSVKWVNTYTPPLHDADGGDASTGLRFMEQIAPDPVERAWLMQWLAHKYRFPWVRGPGVVMVAHESFGTGRGRFCQLMRRVFGARYVHEVSYDTLTGKNGQAQYNEWLSENLIVMVNESAETEAGSTSYQTKKNTYEHLKTLVDPGESTGQRIARKYGGITTEDVFASFVIATNHADAIPIPLNDRRFAVITNGEPRDQDYWEELAAWMGQEANIAAFVGALLAVDLTGYSPHVAPPQTAGKRTMAELSKSDLDRGIDIAVRELGDVFTLDQLVTAMRKAMSEYDLEYPGGADWSKTARHTAAKRFKRVGVPDGHNWQVKIDKKKVGVYAKTAAAAKPWETRHGLRELLVGDAAAGDEGKIVPIGPQSLARSLANLKARDR